MDYCKLYLKDPEIYKSVILSKSEKRVLGYFNNITFITTEWLSGHLELSTQHASGLLSSLYKKGYLERDQAVASSGGIEYIYQVNNKLDIQHI